jgi:hypothetical protein
MSFTYCARAPDPSFSRPGLSVVVPPFSLDCTDRDWLASQRGTVKRTEATKRYTGLNDGGGKHEWHGGEWTGRGPCLSAAIKAGSISFRQEDG